MLEDKTRRNFKLGDIILLSNGEYSDYSFAGPFRVLKPLNFNSELLKELQGNWKPSSHWEQFSPDSVIGGLTSLGYIEDIESSEVWIGAYGKVDYKAFPNT